MPTIKLRRGTAAEWTAANPVLAEGEPGYEKDTQRYKIGDGVKAWNILNYFPSLLDMLSASPIDKQGRQFAGIGWDDFTLRPNGRLDTQAGLPSGQTYTFGYGSATGAALLVQSGELRLTSSGASYMMVDYGVDAAVEGASIEGWFGPGTTEIAGINLTFSKLSPSNGPTGLNGVFTNSVHTTFHGSSLNIGLFDAASGVGLTPLAKITYPAVPNGQKFRGTIRRIGWDRIEVTDPWGVAHIVRDQRIAKYWGNTVGYEHYRPTTLVTGGPNYFTTDREPVITGYLVMRSSRRDLPIDPPAASGVSLVGVPGSVPLTSASVAISQALTHYFPFEVTDQIDIRSAMMEVTTAGAAGAKARLGIALADRNWQPIQRLLDMGEVDVATTGVKTWTSTGNPLRLAGVAGTAPSTPYSPAFVAAGDLRATIKLSLDDWTPGSNMNIGGHWDSGTGDNRGWKIYIASTGKPVLVWTTDGSVATQKTATSTAAVGAADGAVIWLRVTLDVDNGAAGNTVTFETSPDGATWTTLGSPVTAAGVTSIFPSTAPLYFGGDYAPLDLPMTGYLYSAILEKGGVVVSAPTFDNASASFTDPQGNVWTEPASSPWVRLPPGRYLMWFHCSAAFTPRIFRCWTPSIPAVQSAMGASPFTSLLYVTEGYVAMADPPTKWVTAFAAANPGITYPAMLSYSSA
jgi:hypothetical protein